MFAWHWLHETLWTNSWNKFVYCRHCLEFSHMSNFPVPSDQLLSCCLELTCVFWYFLISKQLHIVSPKFIYWKWNTDKWAYWAAQKSTIYNLLAYWGSRTLWALLSIPHPLLPFYSPLPLTHLLRLECCISSMGQHMSVIPLASC